jgi:hypothetical protein
VGIYKKGPYYTECGEMISGDKKFGVVSFALVGESGGILRTAEHFL